MPITNSEEIFEIRFLILNSNFMWRERKKLDDLNLVYATDIRQQSWVFGDDKFLFKWESDKNWIMRGGIKLPSKIYILMKFENFSIFFLWLLFLLGEYLERFYWEQVDDVGDEQFN